jgi:phage tail sheath protein FI
MKTVGNVSNALLSATQASYVARINPSSIPAYDPELDSVVRGTVTVQFDVDAVGTVELAFPVGSASIVQAADGDLSNGIQGTLDHKTGIVSFTTVGTYIPSQGAVATLDVSDYASAVDCQLESNDADSATNNIRLRFVAGGSGSGVLSNSVLDWTFTFANGVTTVEDFADAVAASSSCPFNVADYTNSTLATADAFTFQNFAGGANSDNANPITVDFTPASATKSASDAYGYIVVPAGSALADGENIIIDDGVNTATTFEFDNNGTVSAVAVPFTGLFTATQVRDSLLAAINAQPSSLLVKGVAYGTDGIKLLPKVSTPLSVYLSTTSSSTVGPLGPIAGSGLWVGDVDLDPLLDNYIDYSTGELAFSADADVHNKSPEIAAYTKYAWDLNPISVGAWGNNLKVQVQGSANYYTALTGTYSRFDVYVALYDSGLGAFNVVEQYEELDFSDPNSAVYFADVINELSDYITVTEPAGDVPPMQLNAVGYSQVIWGGNGLSTNQAVSVSLSNVPVQKRTVVISYTSASGAAKTITDDGSGNLVGDVNGAGANVITYATGALSFSTSQPIKANSLVTVVYSKVAAEQAHAEQFGDVSKSYTVGTEGTFNSVNWGRTQFTDATALAASYKGIYAFNKVDDILQVVLPDFAGEVVTTGDLLDYAYSRTQQPCGGDRFIILTTPKGYSAEQAKDWFRFSLGRYSDYAALYWPWVRVTDPLSNNRPLTMPALAHIAGVYARTDNTPGKGVGKAPGGTVDGALNYLLGLESNPTLADRDIVYQNKINPLISSPQTGLAVWGVRTISNSDAWKYVNARRLFMFLEKSVFNAMWWTVFENNGPLLWSRITGQLNGFMNGLFREGFFAGTNPGQAFFVVCDGSNNPPDSVDAGYVVVDIGAAPNKPAEFIRLRFQQKSLTA